MLRRGGRFGVNSADGERLHESALLVREAVLEEGLSQAKAAGSTGTNFRVNQRELADLLERWLRRRRHPETHVRGHARRRGRSLRLDAE